MRVGGGEIVIGNGEGDRLRGVGGALYVLLGVRVYLWVVIAAGLSSRLGNYSDERAQNARMISISVYRCG